MVSHIINKFIDLIETSLCYAMSSNTILCCIIDVVFNTINELEIRYISHLIKIKIIKIKYEKN
jgi:hypothetical protein